MFAFSFSLYSFTFSSKLGINFEAFDTAGAEVGALGAMLFGTYDRTIDRTIAEWVNTLQKHADEKQTHNRPSLTAFTSFSQRCFRSFSADDRSAGSFLKHCIKKSCSCCTSVSHAYYTQGTRARTAEIPSGRGG